MHNMYQWTARTKQCMEIIFDYINSIRLLNIGNFTTIVVTSLKLPIRFWNAMYPDKYISILHSFPYYIYQCPLQIMKRKCKQWWSIIPPILTKRTITSQSIYLILPWMSICIETANSSTLSIWSIPFPSNDYGFK
jgi:hypothetical protein